MLRSNQISKWKLGKNSTNNTWLKSERNIQCYVAALKKLQLYLPPSKRTLWISQKKQSFLMRRGKQTCSTVVLLELVRQTNMFNGSATGACQCSFTSVRFYPTSELRIRPVTTKIKQGKTECKQYWSNKSDHSEKQCYSYTTSTDYKYSLSHFRVI
jgi:hypothetical protein